VIHTSVAARSLPMGATSRDTIPGRATLVERV
jgi:hypothetical protein